MKNSNVLLNGNNIHNTASNSNTTGCCIGAQIVNGIIFYFFYFFLHFEEVKSYLKEKNKKNPSYK